jgi:hypothetical protein
VSGLDPAGIKKFGTESVGVQRQWLGGWARWTMAGGGLSGLCLAEGVLAGG